MSRIVHLALKVEDLERTTEFYRTVFGFKEMNTAKVRDHTSRHLSDGVIDVALIKYDPGTQSAESKAAGEGPCIHHFAVEVDSIAKAKRCVGYEKVQLMPPDRVRLNSDCVSIDLGGLGKGYAVERAMQILQGAGIEHAVVQALPEPLVGVFERQLARGERADAAGDDQLLRGEFVLLCDDGQWGCAIAIAPLQSHDFLAEVYLGLPLAELLGHALDQVLGQHLGESGDVEDVFLGIQRGELAAELIERIDDPERRAAHARVETREHAGRAGSDDGDIFEVGCHRGEW